MLNEKNMYEHAINKELISEIAIRKLISDLFKHKIIIAVITLISLFSGLFVSYFVISPSYESKAVFITRIPEKIETPYGEYIFPSQKLSVYGDISRSTIAINGTLKDLGDTYNRSQLLEMLSSNFQDESLIIAVRANSPEEAYRIAGFYVNNYLNAVNVTIMQIAVNDLLGKANRDVTRLDKLISYSEKELVGARQVLKDIPETIKAESILLDEEQAALYFATKEKQDIKKIDGYMILSSNVNPLYANASIGVSELEMEINKSKNELLIAKQNVIELSNQQDIIQTFLTNQNNVLLLENGLGFQSSIIAMLNPPEINETMISPKRSLIIIGSLAAGLFLGSIIALFMTYYVTKKANKTL